MYKIVQLKLGHHCALSIIIYSSLPSLSDYYRQINRVTIIPLRFTDQSYNHSENQNKSVLFQILYLTFK